MKQLKSNFGLWGTPSAAGTGNDGFTQGAGDPSPEEWEIRTLPTQDNQFPHQTGPTTDEEAINLELGI